MAGLRRNNLLAIRRRVDDEDEEEGGPEVHGVDDDSMSEGSIVSDEEDAADGSELSHIDTHSLPSPDLQREGRNGHIPPPNGHTKLSAGQPASADSTLVPPASIALNDTQVMMNGLRVTDQEGEAEAVEYDSLQNPNKAPIQPSDGVQSNAQMDAQMDQQHESPMDRRRREHQEYKVKRDADPAFVPNRGAFFMHDHRHAGPAANGFKPFGRGRGRGKPGIGNQFVTTNYPHHVVEPTEAPWTHDMHEAMLEADPADTRRTGAQQTAYSGAARPAPQPSRTSPPNRSLSTTKHIGNVQIRVFLSNMKEPVKLPAIPVNQYTRLPEHRPPLRRDKPVRISLPGYPPRYVFPALERSFIFIPRAMRPNQQGFGSRNRGRFGVASTNGYSRRTSVYGGSVYGSVYTPSVAMSRRSSVVNEAPREPLVSSAGSTMPYAPIHMDTTRPVVRLPPTAHSVQVQPIHDGSTAEPPLDPADGPQGETTSIDDLPRPQTYPLPQKPTFRENRPNAIPMHQPRPQKTVSVADIESPASLSFTTAQAYQQPFHQQMPSQLNTSGFHHESHLQPHSRNASYPSQASTGTPLSHIPERAIHAQPFQPHAYPSQNPYYPSQYQVVPAQNYYYPAAQYSTQMVPSAPAFVSAAPPQAAPYGAPQQPDTAASQPVASASLVAQEVNGMVYYYDASQLPPAAAFPTYPAQSYPLQQVNMGGMITPSPDGFYYPHAPQAVVYYPQQ